MITKYEFRLESDSDIEDISNDEYLMFHIPSKKGESEYVSIGRLYRDHVTFSLAEWKEFVDAVKSDNKLSLEKIIADKQICRDGEDGDDISEIIDGIKSGKIKDFDKVGKANEWLRDNRRKLSRKYKEKQILIWNGKVQQVYDIKIPFEEIEKYAKGNCTDDDWAYAEFPKALTKPLKEAKDYPEEKVESIFQQNMPVLLEYAKRPNLSLNSDWEMYLNTEAYKQIIELGKRTIPYIYQGLKKLNVPIEFTTWFTYSSPDLIVMRSIYFEIIGRVTKEDERPDILKQRILTKDGKIPFDDIHNYPQKEKEFMLKWIEDNYNIASA